MSKIPTNLLNGWDIVVVDDEPDSLEVASIILRVYGANVFTGVDGNEALALVRKVRPHFVISDLSMPFADGWSFLNALKQDHAIAETPVIALTAHAMKGDRDRAVAAGFQSYLIKPLTPETFMDQLVALLVDIPLLSEQLNL